MIVVPTLKLLTFMEFPGSKQTNITWALCPQINVVVGAFFVISGYVAAYTTTTLGQQLGRMWMSCHQA